MKSLRTNISLFALATYLLALNVFVLFHSFEHHTSKNVSLFDTDKEITVVHSDTSNSVCELCDLFQNQVIYFSDADTIHLCSTLFDLQDGAHFEGIPFKKDRPQLRGPPALS